MRRRKFIILSLKLIILVAIILISILNFKTTLDQSIQENSQLTFIKEPPAKDYVLKKFAYISGAINKPGVYELNRSDTRLIELIEMAGGLASDADTNAINSNLNLSSVIKDSDHIFIPTKNVSQVNGNSTSNKINLNSASLKELDSLPGIGESTAQKIINARPFSSINDIKDVSGIGDSKFNQIKDLITVE